MTIKGRESRDHCWDLELDESDWELFTELLDRPAQVPAGLRDLYLKPSVFE